MHHDSISLGQPRFLDADLAAIATHPEGVLAAWQDGYARHGSEIATRVEGEYAVGLRLPDGGAFLATDRFASHTLCWRVAEGRLQFAARADAWPDAAPALEPQALYDYLHFHVIPSPRTQFAGVSRLPAGCLLVHDAAGTMVRPWWTPRFEAPARIAFASRRERFLQLLQDSVARALSGPRAACFLSGGTDSSTVAGLIGRIRGEPAETYSIGFGAEGYDEMEYARITARHFGTRHHEHYLTADELLSIVPRLAAGFDQPFGNSSAAPTYQCAAMARADGIDRLLAGDGGDELFGGNTRYAKQQLFDAWAHLPAGLRHGVLEPLLTAPGAARLPGLGKAASYVTQARVPMPDRLGFYNLLERFGPENVLTPALLGQVDRHSPLRQQREVWSAARCDAALDRTLAFDWRYTLAESDLPKVRGAAAAAGVEVAFPLLDDALLHFSMALPARDKLRHGRLRWFFKEALRGFLPDATIRKRKHGFGLPFGVWAVTHPGLRALARESVFGVAERGIVRADFAQTLLDEHLEKHPGYFGEMVWILMMLEQWMRRRAPHFALRG